MEVTSSKDVERAERLRNNKRCHRQRQKEYVADLEQKLREFQIKGVQASVEIQLAARKVAQENERLRELLRHVGIGEVIIKSWVDGTQDDDGKGCVCPPSRLCSGMSPCDHADAKAEAKHGPTRLGAPNGHGALLRAAGEDAPIISHGKADLTTCTSSSPCDNVEPPRNSSMLESELKIDQIGSVTCLAPGTSECLTRERKCSNTDVSFSGDTSISLTIPPCKVLTRLKANPWAEITQSEISPENELKPDDGNDGISCSRAHQMLMQYATTEAKLDAVAHVLEQGCVPNEGAGEGCKIKSKTILQALNDVCL